MLCTATAPVPALGAQTVAISPGYTSIGVNQTVQYTATITVLVNKDAAPAGPGEPAYRRAWGAETPSPL